MWRVPLVPQTLSQKLGLVPYGAGVLRCGCAARGSSVAAAVSQGAAVGGADIRLARELQPRVPRQSAAWRSLADTPLAGRSTCF